MDIQKTIQYKYILYQFKKRCKTNDMLQNLRQEDKDSICIDVAKKTRTFTLILGIMYLFAFSFFWFEWMMNPQYQNNAFIKWYLDTLYSIYPLVNGDWGSGWYRKKATFLMIYIKLLPIFIIDILPLLILTVIAANHFLTNGIDAELLKQNKQTEL